MAARDLVFHPGDRVRAWGQFVANADGDWLDLARIDNLLPKPPGWTSAWSIRLIGAGADIVAAHQNHGCISVIGIWRGDTIEVEEQSPDIPGPEPIPDWTNPPCAPPSGGWPRSAEQNPPGLNLGDLEASGALVCYAAFRPSADQVVVVVAATDVDAVIRQLAPQLPNRLCIVESRFTRAQLDDVRNVLFAHSCDWQLQKFGNSVDERAQPFVQAAPFRVTAELAQWADALPAGLLRLYPSLLPV